MKGKTCVNCYWYEQCPERGTRCEDYDPIYGEGVAVKEYMQDLKERDEEYRKVVEEQQS